MPAESTARNSTKAIEYTLQPTPATSYTPGTRAQASAPYGYNTAMYPQKRSSIPPIKNPKAYALSASFPMEAANPSMMMSPPVAIRIPYH